MVTTVRGSPTHQPYNCYVFLLLWAADYNASATFTGRYFSGHLQPGGDLRQTQNTLEGLHKVSHLAWEELRIPQEKLKDMVGGERHLSSSTLFAVTDGFPDKRFLGFVGGG